MGLIKQTRDAISRVERLATQPHEELTRWQRSARFVMDVIRYGWRRLREDRAPQMAAALSYRTLFGLLPVLVVGSVLFKASQGVDGVKALAARIVAALGLNDYQLVLPGQEGMEQTSSAGDWLVGLAGEAANINLTALGWVGLAVVIYSAISLIITIENSFNTIYRAPSGRAWVYRVPIYWTVLTLGTAGIAITFYVDQRFDAWIATLSNWALLVKTLTLIWGYCASVLVLFLVYKLLPNTRVSVRAALVGAMIAAFLVEIGKRSLGAYFENALSLRQLYGSLGLVPLFMLWVYLMWLVILFGLEIAATVQFVRGRQFERLERASRSLGLVDPTIVITLVGLITRSFRAGKPVTARELSDRTAIPELLVDAILARLTETGYLHRLDRDDQAVALARPPEEITADKLLELGYKLADQARSGRPGSFIDRLRGAQLQLASGSTMAQLSAEGQVST